MVVGINTLGAPMASSLGFAIPIDVVRRVIDRLRIDGRVLRSHTGLTLRPLVDFGQSTVFQGEKGVIVDDVAPASPAETAGIRKGDRLMRVGGKETNGRYREDLPGIHWTLADLPDGHPALLEVDRQGRTVTVELLPDLCEGCDDLGFETPVWNASFQGISRDRVPDIAFHKKAGIYVLGVKYPGITADAGLREGDILLSVDRRPIEDLPALAAAYPRSLADGRPRRTVLLEILRDGRRSFLALDMERTPPPEKR
jgi:S1-C subfamily serine protease